MQTEWTPAPFRRDAMTLILSLLLVALTWGVVFHLRPGLLASGHDGLHLELPLLRDLAAQAGNGSDWLYRPQLLGGAKIQDIHGTLPLVRWLAGAGLGAGDILNALMLSLQAIYGFLALHLTESLAELWSSDGSAGPSGSSKAPPPLQRIAALWTLCFCPVLGWKLGHGHLSLVLGELLFFSLLALAAAAAARRLTLPLLLVSFAASTHSVVSLGQQTLVYSLFFGWPLALGVAWTGDREEMKGRLIRMAPALAALLAAVAVCLPQYQGMVTHALSGDSPRDPAGEAITFSYITASLRDWVSSIPWGKDLIRSGRELAYEHEVNYPAGPLLLLLLLAPWRRRKAFTAAFFVPLILILLYSMDVGPTASTLHSLFPPLKSFRVPERAMLGFSLLLPVVGIAGLWSRARIAPGSWARDLALLCLPLGMLAGPWPREALAWAAVALLVPGLLGRHRFAHRLAPVALMVLAGASLGAFRERLLPFVPVRPLMESVAEISSKLRAADGKLAHPLFRSQLRFALPEFGSNTAYVLGLSSLDGYWNPPKRFIQLLLELEGQPFMPTLNNLALDERSAGFRTLRPLYNVTSALDFRQGRIQVLPIGPTAGPAWFSSEIQVAPSLSELASTLKAQQDRLHETARETAWVVGSDPAVARWGAVRITPPLCRKAQVLGADALKGGQEIRLSVRSEGDCPLSIAMNYTENLRAVAHFQGREPASLPMLPTYGALTGLLVPPGEGVIVIAAQPVRSLWADALCWLGWALLAAAVAGLALSAHFLRRTEPSAG